MAKIDFKRELKHLYRPSAKEFQVVDVPPMNFLMIDGHGDPNKAQEYADAVEALYALAYRLKFMSKKALGKDDVKRVVERMKEREVQAVAVCLLHSYANPAHEQLVKSILAEECPEMDVSLSSEILPEIKEYERMSTTAMNACVVPVVNRYLNNLEERLAELGMSGSLDWDP